MLDAGTFTQTAPSGFRRHKPKTYDATIATHFMLKKGLLQRFFLSALRVGHQS